MNRFNDHLRFAVRFVGLGYVVLWPLSTPAGGELFGASLLCKGGGALGLVCGLPHPLQLGVGLHVAGALCALASALHFLLRGAVRMRRRRTAALAPEECVPAPAAPPRRVRRPRMPPPRKDVAPRTHFGLRGVTR